MHTERYFDPDPPARRSPRLYSDVGAVPRSARAADSRARAINPAKLRRLRLMAIIKACRDASPPVPVSTLIGGLGIPETTVRRLYKKACKYDLRRSRV
jgi:hypothetical protein